MRVSPPRVFPDVSRAPRPAAGSPGSDAHRQTGFVLGAEIEAILEGLRCEAQIAEHLSAAKFRKMEIAGFFVFFSRSWLSRVEALHAAEGGNYVSSFPLLRAAADYAAAATSMLGSGGEEWTNWATAGGIGRAPEEHATEFALHPFRSAEELARNPNLGGLYRAATVLTLPHFGATALIAANASGEERFAATFGDRDFHLGLAELALGLLAGLGREHLQLTIGAGQRLALGDLELRASELVAGLSGIVSRPDRCRLDFVEIEGRERASVERFRRAPGGAAARFIL